jgi:hypothetical protein
MTIRFNPNAADSKCADCKAIETTGYSHDFEPAEPVPNTITRTCEDCGNDFIIGTIS